MNGHLILRKTGLGHEEAKSRERITNTKIRTLLIFVNGQSTIDDLHETLSKMPSYEGRAYLEKSLQELIDTGFITDASEKIVEMASAYGIDNWTEKQASEAKSRLISIANKVLATNAKKVVNKLENAPDTKEGIIAAVDASEKLVRLFIDEKKATLLAEQCRSVLAEFK